MLFRRRVPPSRWDTLRTLVWPRRSFARSIRYFSKRVLRLRATPHAVAVGVAAGVFASFLPFMGFHFIIAAALAWLLAGNIVASALGTAFGNPLTFPFLWGASYEAGKLMLHGHAGHTPASLGSMLQTMDLAQLWRPVLEPMLLGALPLGAVFGLAFYALTRWGMASFQERRRLRLAVRRAGTVAGGAAAGP